jgi:hypothetical protein
MIYLQHNDPIICLPQHISRYGFYSAHLFLLNAICNYLYNYNWLAFIGLSLYITSLLHWYKIQYNGLFKTLDVATCIVTINSITFYDSTFFCPQNRLLWYLSAFLCIVTYLLNRYIEFYQVQCKGSRYFLADEPYHYFLLKYTWPNTLQRELAYKYNVFVHILFLHVNLSCACIYGVVSSPSCSNYWIK